MDFCENELLRHRPETSNITVHSVKRRLKVNHSFPLSICLNYCSGMLQLVILLLSRDSERLQITHPKLTSQFESLHPAKQKSSLETSKICYHPLCILSMPLFHQTNRSHKSSGILGLLFPSPRGVSSFSATHSAQDSRRQFFLKLPLDGPFQKPAPETDNHIINHLDSIYPFFYACSPPVIRRLFSPRV